jgi:DNA-binding NarL/FixJ family response regulator
MERGCVVTPPSLTCRQLEVARLLAQDFTPKQIAQELGISMGCVSAHISHMRARLSVNTPTGIVLRLIEAGMIKKLISCSA